jgi:hypothetical protein
MRRRRSGAHQRPGRKLSPQWRVPDLSPCHRKSAHLLLYAERWARHSVTQPSPRRRDQRFSFQGKQTDQGLFPTRKQRKRLARPASSTNPSPPDQSLPSPLRPFARTSFRHWPPRSDQDNLHLLPLPLITLDPLPLHLALDLTQTFHVMEVLQNQQPGKSALNPTRLSRLKFATHLGGQLPHPRKLVRVRLGVGHNLPQLGPDQGAVVVKVQVRVCSNPTTSVSPIDIDQERPREQTCRRNRRGSRPD